MLGADQGGVPSAAGIGRDKRGMSVGGKWRATLGKISRANKMAMKRATEAVFPEARNLPKEDLPRNPNAAVESSVPLQVLLYTNTIYFCVWVVLFLLIKRFKSWVIEPPTAFKVVDPFVLALFIIIEPLRLAFGWNGNLGEKVPQIGTFFLLSFFPALPCTVYFVIAAPQLLPAEKALGYIYLAFVIMQAGVSAVVTRRFIRSQSVRFYTTTFGDNVDPVTADHQLD